MPLSAPKYLAICIGSALLALTAVGAINFVVDPYGMFHYEKSWDWPHHRAGIHHFLYGFKARIVQDVKSDTLLFGSSRVLFGIDPNNAALPRNSYNLGLEGGDTYVAWRYLQHAAAAHMPKTVILGTDLQSFDHLTVFSSEFSEDRLSVTPDGHPNYLSSFADIGSTLFSTTALYYSVKSVIDRTDPNSNYDRGFQGDDLLNVEHMDLAHNVAEANHAFLVPPVFVANDPDMVAFEKIVSFCAANHIRLIVFVNPLHSSLTDIFTADWDNYCNWMKTIVGKMESVPGAQTELWDFTGYYDLNTESFPLPSDTYSHMRNFWECSHYHSQVGGMVLARMFTNGGPANFGQIVTSANLQEDLDRIKAEKEAWHAHGQAVVVSQTNHKPPE